MFPSPAVSLCLLDPEGGVDHAVGVTASWDPSTSTYTDPVTGEHWVYVDPNSYDNPYAQQGPVYTSGPQPAPGAAGPAAVHPVRRPGGSLCRAGRNRRFGRPAAAPRRAGPGGSAGLADLGDGAARGGVPGARHGHQRQGRDLVRLHQPGDLQAATGGGSPGATTTTTTGGSSTSTTTAGRVLHLHHDGRRVHRHHDGRRRPPPPPWLPDRPPCSSRPPSCPATGPAPPSPSPPVSGTSAGRSSARRRPPRRPTFEIFVTTPGGSPDPRPP